MSKNKKELSPDLLNLQNEIIESVRSGKSLLGQGGVLTPLIKQALEAALEGEIDSHISSSKEEGISNRRNGKGSKIIKSSSGNFEISTPRDRDCSFEPQIVKKRQTVLNESLDNHILELLRVFI